MGMEVNEENSFDQYHVNHIQIGKVLAFITSFAVGKKLLI